MSRFLSVATALNLLSRSALTAGQSDLIGGCISYGMDFQGGGEYFQNVNSADPFTFVQEFEGCQADNSTNILVDPNGGQYTCSKTPMQPDLADELSTCPLYKNQLSSGPWSILILSNNGADGAPIAFERDFLLDVGPQSTTTATPTITSTTFVVPTVNLTTTTTVTNTTTLPAVTTTVPSTTVQKTKTVTPVPVVVMKTSTLATVTIPKLSVTVTKVVKTVTASCHLPRRQPTADPFIKIIPKQAAAKSIVSSAASAAGESVPTATAPAGASKKFRFARDPLYDLEHNRKQWLQERSERLGAIVGLGRRAPDAQPLTVTEQNTANFVTVTSTSTTTAITNTIFTTSAITSTVTPVPVTVVSGKTYLPPATVTLPATTSIRTTYIIAKVTTTKTQTIAVTITTTTAPAASKTACRSHGGIYY